MEKKLTTGRSFFLRQVDPLQVAKSYLAGELRLPKGKAILDNSVITPDIEVGDSYDSEIYEIVDKNGERLRLVTTDHQRWLKNGSDLSNYNYLCHWCRADHVGEPICIPIKIEREKSTGKYLFSGTGSYCCFECAYADLKTKTYCGFY